MVLTGKLTEVKRQRSGREAGYEAGESKDQLALMRIGRYPLLLLIGCILAP